jgi:hypothetical protein
VATFADYQGEDRHYLLQPIEVDRFSGFAANSPVIGEEFRSRPHTVVEEAAKAADARAYPDKNAEEIEKAKARGDTPFGGLDAHSHLHHVTGPAFMDRPGERLSVPDRLQIEVKPLDQIELKMRLRGMLGRQLTTEDNANLRAWYPEGVLEEHLQLVADRLEGKQDTAPKLVAVK